MKNIKLFEEFNGKNIPQEKDLVLQIVDFLGLTDKFKSHRRPYWDKSSSFIQREAFGNVYPSELYQFLLDQGYSVSTYPELSPSAMKATSLMGKISYSNNFEGQSDGYAFIILIDCTFNNKQAKTCLVISGEDLSISVLGDPMQEVSIKKWNENAIEMIFWNGEYLVTGEFDQVDVYRDDDIVSINFESSETSDGKSYILSVNATGSWSAGYDLGDIEYLDFA
jgi:hypothetical protein